MYECMRDQLRYSVTDIKRLKAIIIRQNNWNTFQDFPLFPDSAEYQRRREIYNCLSGFRCLKKSVYPAVFQYAQSLKTTPGIKSKHHYEDDPDGIKKHEMWNILTETNRLYYDAIRHTEILIANTNPKTAELLLVRANTALITFNNSLNTITAKWATGAYGNTPPASPPKRTIRRRRGAIKEAVALFKALDVDITSRTLSRWLNGNAPNGFPGIEDPVSLSQWANSYDYKERRKYQLCHNMSEESIQKNRLK